MQPQTQKPAASQQKPNTGSTVNDDLGLGGDIDFSKMGMSENEMKEAQKMFEDVMKQMGNMQDEGTGTGNMENPFMAACSEMFKDFENIQKQEKTTNTSNAPGAGPIPGLGANFDGDP